jgi:hypothetical protein
MSFVVSGVFELCFMEVMRGRGGRMVIDGFRVAVGMVEEGVGEVCFCEYGW